MMTAPRMEVDLDALDHNARTLVGRLGRHGVEVTGVTKAVLGHPEVARTLLDAGIRTLADSRIENIEAMRNAGITAPISLLRSPMPSQVDRVVAHADRSHNTELEVVRALSAAAVDRGLVHGIVVMVEFGDLREGVLPEDVGPFVREMGQLPGVALAGLGTNLACRSGVVPGRANMAELSRLVEAVEVQLGRAVGLVSGGNSATLDWALGEGTVGRVNDLRLGEAILLGRDPLHRRPIEGLRTDVCTFVAEVIESGAKPSMPWGDLAQAAFGTVPAATDRGRIVQTILAAGEQDVDPMGLTPPAGVRILGASSDHLVVETRRVLAPGTWMRFQPDYAALLRAMTSPYVATIVRAPEPAIAGAPTNP